jgi:hypothetical protein
VIYSGQDVSVDTINEYTSYLSNVHEVNETLDQVTFNVKEVMFLMEMTNFQELDNKVYKKIKFFIRKFYLTKSLTRSRGNDA